MVLGGKKIPAHPKIGPTKKTGGGVLPEIWRVPENWKNMLDHPPLKKRTEKSLLGNQRRLGVDHVDGEKSKSDLGSNPPKMQLLQMKGLAWSSQTQRRCKRHRGGDKPEGGEPRSDLKMELVDRNFILKMENPQKKSETQVPHPQKTRGIKQFSLPHTFP